ncbi:transferase with NAD(P)-binding Rossmann-fold domain; UPF0052 family [Escherichia coli]|uniref:Transferase with NAD(P)-binding Rossmann-fold domain UPF0052 family n=1 Tax=Escherichia coli TaxID=562 RepID=A0A376TJQ3_ECOLX|nr:transferase with NAD(P)-binding Rossmann-fold domain; UPF0052 family [Escherichia coli]
MHRPLEVEEIVCILNIGRLIAVSPQLRYCSADNLTPGNYMRNRTLADLDRVVALGGGHGLGRVLSSLSSLGSRLTGIVTTTDNGGSTGRIRRSEGGIAWGDMRNCLNQLITEPSVASAMLNTVLVQWRTFRS